MNEVVHKSVTLAVGATVSEEIDLYHHKLCGLFLPAEFDGTAITFQGSTASGGTFHPVHNSAGTAISLTVAASRLVTLDPDLIAGVRFLKLVCGTAQATTATVITAILRQQP